MKGHESYEYAATLYDYVPAYMNRGDLEFYLDYSKSVDGKVLELGCGTGRILIPVAESGKSITGLDMSPSMLRRCREKLADKPQYVQDRVTLIQGDMTNFDLGETFDLITMPFRPFQHLVEIEHQMACLNCIYRHLNNCSKLVMDFFQVDPKKMFSSQFDSKEVEDFSETALPDGNKLRRTHRIPKRNWSKQYNDVELIYYVTYPDGQTDRYVQAFPFRYFFRYEIEHLFARCGFKILELFGDFDKSPLQDDSPEMIFVVQSVS